ncbi:MAG: EAL domain-containing protein [Parvularculaceae bacterium]
MGAQAVRLSNVDIDNALKNKDFEVLFQPIFDLGNGALARVETFIRWRHPALGVLPPGAFISFFETQGRMSELTRYVLGEALSAYLEWRGPYAPGFSINLALSDLSDESFSSHFTRLLRAKNFPAELVTLECPMPPVDADVAAVSRQLDRLAQTGARLAIEVRGRANDFLKSVEPFPFAEIKTGGAAILRFARTVRGPGLGAISELIEFANDQKAAITAVGVEDQASLSALRGLGFAAAQGNHLSKVGPLNQFLPSHVNDVRALLELEPLSADDLAALFRTGAPKLPVSENISESPLEKSEEDAQAAFDETAATTARKKTAKSKAATAPAKGEDDLIDRLAARIAESGLAKGESARAKAAAIARARRKKLEARNALRDKAEAMDMQTAPRDLQERLTREFEAFSESGSEMPASDELDETLEFEEPSTLSATDEFEIEGAETDAAEAAAGPEVEDRPLAALDGDTTNAKGIESSAGDEAAEAPETPEPTATFTEGRLGKSKGHAHFAPVIRVSQPEPGYAPAVDAGSRAGDLFDDETVDAVFDANPDVDLEETDETVGIQQADKPGDEATALQDDEAEEAELAIPAETEAEGDWVEETVAMAKALRRKPVPKKSFLTRTVIPYSALKITHFWPRFKRRKNKLPIEEERETRAR